VDGVGDGGLERRRAGDHRGVLLELAVAEDVGVASMPRCWACWMIWLTKPR
jgi:hypothetical protein